MTNTKIDNNSDSDSRPTNVQPQPFENTSCEALQLGLAMRPWLKQQMTQSLRSSAAQGMMLLSIPTPMLGQGCRSWGLQTGFLLGGEVARAPKNTLLAEVPRRLIGSTLTTKNFTSEPEKLDILEP